jgi:hypothetical protein
LACTFGDMPGHLHQTTFNDPLRTFSFARFHALRCAEVRRYSRA